MRKPARPARSLDDVLGPAPDLDEAPAAAIIRDGDARHARGTAAPAPEDGGKAVTYFVTPSDRRRLRQVSLDTELSLHEICREAIDLWLNAKGLPGLEPQAANRGSAGRKRN